MKQSNIQRIAIIAMLSAIATIVQFISVPIIPLFSFLMIDLSDILILISLFLLGPIAGISTAFIRTCLHLFFTGFALQNLVGDGASFLASLFFTLPIYYFFQVRSFSFHKTIGLIAGTLSLTLFMSIGNYFIITPIYLKLFGMTAKQFLGTNLATYITFGIIPFNLIKGVLVSIVFMIFYIKIHPFLTRQRRITKEKHS